MAIKRLYYYTVLKCVNKLLSGTRFFGLKRKLLNSIGISVGNNTSVVGPIKIGGAAKLKIDDNCWIGENLTIHGNGTVNIESECDLAPEVTFLTGSHEISNVGRRAGDGITFNYNVGQGSWIGAKTTIINGAVLGERTVVGACALVTKDCDANALYLGSPAVKKKNFSN